jgi:hypothetical protein
MITSSPDINARLEKALNQKVNTLSGKDTLSHLIHRVGVKRGITYYNYVEKYAPKSTRSAIEPTVVKKIVHDYGLEFNDGLLLKHIAKYVFTYAISQGDDVEVTEIKERLAKNNFLKIPNNA